MYSIAIGSSIVCLLILFLPMLIGLLNLVGVTSFPKDNTKFANFMDNVIVKKIERIPGVIKLIAYLVLLSSFIYVLFN